MGYIRNHAIVVSSWNDEDVLRAHRIALNIFNEHKMGGLVSGVVQHIANGGAAFFISPDGSKEGWEPSDRGNEARSEFIKILESKEFPFVDWALLLLGGDDGEYAVINSPNSNVDVSNVA